MEYQKFRNLLDTASENVPRFITKKWVEVHDQSGSAEDRYNPSKQIRFKTSMLRSDLCDFSDSYIVVKGKVVANFNDRKNYCADDFPDELFPDNIFPDGTTAAQISTARTPAKAAALKFLLLMKQIIMIENILSEVLLLETMVHLLVVFQRLMAY